MWLTAVAGEYATPNNFAAGAAATTEMLEFQLKALIVKAYVEILNLNVIEHEP